MTTLYHRAVQGFRARFLREPELVVRAPGRVNLLGGHTDYNEGFVLPVAVDRAAWVAVAACREPQATLRALDMGNDEVIFSVRRVPASTGNWADYPKSLVWAFLERGLRPVSCEAVLTSDVPVGAGMSSSAAVELAFAYAWNVLSGFGLTLDELALLSRQAENEYVGVNCGIMDQLVSACGRAGTAIALDTRTLQRAYVSLPAGVAIVVADSRVRRTLASSEYNLRRARCEQAVALLQTQLPHIQALRDVTPKDLQRYGSLLPDVVLRRVRHVVRENIRVKQAARALHRGDLATVGALLKEGHRSLRDDYEVSAPELDVLVEAACEVPGCYGARLTGAGFGGCSVALADEAAVPELETHLVETYTARFDKEPAVYVVYSADGVAAVQAA